MASNQSVSWQRRMLRSAQAAGDTDLYFILQMTQHGRTMPAALANGIVPAIPVGDEYDSAPEWAHLLLEVARLGTPGAVLSTALTTRALLEEAIPGRWSEWAPIDDICPFCGGIRCPLDCLPPGYSRIQEIEDHD